MQNVDSMPHVDLSSDSQERENLIALLRYTIFHLEYAEASKGYKLKKLGKHKRRRLNALMNKLNKFEEKPIILN